MPNTQLPLTPEDMQRWYSDIEAGERVRKQYEPWWLENIKKYSPPVDTDPTTFGTNINTNRDFQVVEQKKAQLFFQTPDCTLKPAPLMEAIPDAGDALVAHQDLVNEYLADDQRVNAAQMVDDVLFDVLCPAGFGITKMGYESITEEVEVDQPIPDPVTGAPAADPMTGAPLTVLVKVQVPIWERLFWEKLSPKKLVLPSGFTSTNYDKAPWIATKFTMTLNEARLSYNLPDDFEAKAGKDEAVFDHAQATDRENKGVEGVEIWYRATIYDDTVKNPDLLRVLVLIKGLEKPVKHMNSPYQDLDPATGRLSPQSLKGYPIHILTLRSLTDSAYVMSDCSISRPQVNELNVYRGQQVKMRDSNIPIRIAHGSLPPETIQKLKAADYGGDPISVPEDAWAATNGEPIREIAKATYPRENMAFEDRQDNDIARTHAMDANQGGVKTDTARTATELQLIQVNTNVRLDKERAKVLRWYVAGVTKFSTLVQRFVTVEQAAEVIGPQRAQLWAQVMKMVPASLAFTAAPDSAMRIDSAQNRKFVMEAFSWFRPDPRVNTDAFLTKKVFPSMGMDSSYLATPQPPQPPPPDPIRAQVMIRGEDLSPLAPQYAGSLLVLKAAGMDVTGMPPAAPPELQMAAAYPGPAKPISSGGSSESQGTNNMQGSQMPAPIAPGGVGMSNAE